MADRRPQHSGMIPQEFTRSRDDGRRGEVRRYSYMVRNHRNSYIIRNDRNGHPALASLAFLQDNNTHAPCDTHWPSPPPPLVPYGLKWLPLRYLPTNHQLITTAICPR